MRVGINEKGTTGPAQRASADHAAGCRVMLRDETFLAHGCESDGTVAGRRVRMRGVEARVIKPPFVAHLHPARRADDHRVIPRALRAELDEVLSPGQALETPAIAAPGEFARVEIIP